MAPNLINRLFQPTAQESSSQHPAQAATPADDEPEFEAIDIGIERIERPAWLVKMVKYEDRHYQYKVKFAGRAGDDDGRCHEYDKYSGIIAVPEARVKQRVRYLFRRNGKIDIPRNNDSRCEALLGKIVDIEHHDSEEYFVRQLQVTHGAKGSRYRGECFIPRSEETPTRWAYEAKFAVQSIEPVPDEPEPKRTVVFRGVPHEGKKVQVEVWQLDGQDSYCGTADVYQVDRAMDSEVQKVYLTIRAPVSRGNYLWLQGDYVENGSKRSGPFVEVDEPGED